MPRAAIGSTNASELDLFQVVRLASSDGIVYLLSGVIGK